MDKLAGARSWPLTSVWYCSSEWNELYLTFPIGLTGMHNFSFTFTFIIQEQVILNLVTRGQQLGFLKVWHLIVFEYNK